VGRHGGAKLIDDVVPRFAGKRCQRGELFDVPRDLGREFVEGDGEQASGSPTSSRGCGTGQMEDL
jgi:hypothetical protein